MMRKPSPLLVDPTSGFVPFSGGSSLHGELDAVPRFVAYMPPRTAPFVEERPPSKVAPVVHAPLAWEPRSAASARRVEQAVLAAICCYFTFGLGKLLGLM